MVGKRCRHFFVAYIVLQGVALFVAERDPGSKPIYAAKRASYQVLRAWTLTQEVAMANRIPGRAILVASIAAAAVVFIFVATWAFVNQLG